PSGTGLWVVGNLAVNATATLGMTATVNAGTNGSVLLNKAIVTAVDQADPTPGDARDSIAVTVQAADLAVTKAVDNATPNEGNAISYTVTLRNNGPNGATNVGVTDLLPVGVTYRSSTPSQGSYASGTGLWTVGTLANATTATLALKATVDAGTHGATILNKAFLT